MGQNLIEKAIKCHYANTSKHFTFMFVLAIFYIARD